MSKKLLIYFLAFLILIDLGYSFLQYYNTPLDGDMAGCIVPSAGVKNILIDPFGISVLTENTSYPNPNRFFSHWVYHGYFRNVPLFIQNFTNPINSVYLSAALAKIIMHALILFLLAVYISRTRNFTKLDFLISAALVVPLFQANGYAGYMGIIDGSITYTFFYALPMGLLLLFYLPFLNQLYHNGKLSLNIATKILLLILAMAVTLSGPLNPGIALVITLLFIFHLAITRNKIRGNELFFLIPISVLSLYSLYIGSYNSLNLGNEFSILQLYSKLPEGIYYQFTQKLGFPILFLIIAINVTLIRKHYYNHEGQKILSTLKWIGIFALVYIILLPIGGYREYRPDILRYDTIMPVTLSIFYIYGLTTLFLIKSISKQKRGFYLLAVVCVAIIFTNADEPEFHKDDCQRNALTEIANSTDDVVLLESDCKVLSWKNIETPEASKLNSELLNYWNVSTDGKLYYHRMPVKKIK